MLLSALLGYSLAASSIASGATQQAQNDPAGTSPPAAEPLAYTVAIEGELEEPLRERLENTSNLNALSDRPPQTSAGLQRRIERDKERLLEVLRAEGFYNGKIDAVVDETVSPAAVTLNIDTGTVYLLEEYELRYMPPVPEDVELFPREPEDLGLELGMRAQSAEILRASRDLIIKLGQVGRPLASIADDTIIVDHNMTTMRVAIDIDAGPRSVFGPLSLSGLESVSPDYVRRLVSWTEGELYDQRKVREFRTRLVATELFDGVAIDHAETAGAGGALPMELQVQERKHRSLGAGASISTDQGLAGNVFWEHRNLLGENEKLRIEARAGLIEQSLTGDFTKPNFLIIDQNLLLNATFRRQEDDAFDEQTVSVFAGLERGLFDNWRVSAGPSFEYSILTDAEGEERFELFGFPMSARRDDTDDLLNATSGTRLFFKVTPYFGAIEEAVTFGVFEAGGDAFLSLDADDRIVLAARTRVGSIFGEDTETIPANKRFYAGGGGSVRGYPFRSLGPLDADNDPLGGRSVFELGFESRFRVSENIGVVPFIEGGSVFDEMVPQGIGDLRWAAGLGLRYFTAVGPLRLDVATPLDRRSDVDDAFEIYLSIGQAF